jgi:hypothetical protein
MTHFSDPQSSAARYLGVVCNAQPQARILRETSDPAQVSCTRCRKRLQAGVLTVIEGAFARIYWPPRAVEASRV